MSCLKSFLQVRIAQIHNSHRLEVEGKFQRCCIRDVEFGDKVGKCQPPKIKPKRTKKMNGISHLGRSFQEIAHSS